MQQKGGSFEFGCLECHAEMREMIGGGMLACMSAARVESLQCRFLCCRLAVPGAAACRGLLQELHHC